MYPILISLVITIEILFFILIFFRHIKKISNITFSLVVLFGIFWTASNFLADIISSDAWALFLTKSAYSSTSAIPLLLLAFTLFFPKKESPAHFRRYKIFVIPAGIALIILSYTNLIVSGISRYETGVNIVAGRLFSLYSAYFAIYMGVAITLIIRKFRNTTGIEKQQLQYLLAGILITTIGGATFNLLLPTVTGDFSYTKIGPSFILFLIGFTSYSIVKHRLFDIRVIAIRSVLYAILVSFVGLAFILALILSSQFFGGSNSSKSFLSFGAAIIIVFTLDPLKRQLSIITDRIFFKARINYQQVLQELSETLNFELDRTNLIKAVRETLTRELKIKSAATLQRVSSNGGTERFDASSDMLAKNANLTIRNDSPLISYLREHRHVAILESLERKIDDSSADKRQMLEASRDEFVRMGAALVAPVFAQGHMIAVLVLGQKLSGDSFSNDDVQLIEVLSPQIGSAIQKANLFQEVKEFSAELQHKVDDATVELRERNTSLQTIQKITREITRTLDFNQVVQQIADSVATELGYMGAILVFVDEDGVTIRARAISQTTLTAKAIALLPRSFSELTTRLDDPDDTNLAHQVLHHGETMMTRSMAQVISPPLPKLLATEIQKLLHIKTVVIVPINSEGKTIGCIEIGVQKPQEEITRYELDTMQSLADELGVLARNLNLFAAIQTTNRKLEVANKHLQELDRAKSEFVSIASHQLRTPMTGIKGYLSMMTDGDFGPLDPKHVEILRNLLAESDRMIRLINQFLNVSKIEAGKFTYEKKPVRLDALVRKQVNELRKAATDKKLKLEFKAPKKSFPETLADPDKLEDVVLNLIDNAIKYTASGEIEVSLDSTAKDIAFAVKDTGIGIKKRDAGELFSKFMRGSGIAQIHPDGSGLGLFIAKSIVDAHGGKIWAESAGEGKGSTFRFTIPIITPEMTALTNVKS